jgi:urease subunit alpha
MRSIDRATYARLYGPTTGDSVRLGDTSLFAEIEHDYTVPGYELLIGAGKSFRDGEGVAADVRASGGALDFVIQNAMIIDAELGIVKGDLGIKDGRIVGVGKAGNPAVMPGVDPRLIVGPATTPISGEDYIITAGAIESHAHINSPEQGPQSLAGGTTTLVGGSPGPAFEVGSGTTHNLGVFLQGAEEYPVNLALLARGGSDPGVVEDSVASGGMGVKVHEDFGASPAVIDGSLTAADRNDFAVHLHTDSINEFGFAEDTMAAIDGRSIHMYHVEGAGGGHAPDILSVVSAPNVIPSSTNPTNPYTLGALEEGVPMAMIGHRLNINAPEDVAFAEARIRPQTMSAEDYLHDMGAISIFGTDSQGMGRLAENVAKCWQLASVMKDRVGRLPEETTARSDNERIKRYIAKLTINPAIAVGIDKYVGSIAPGKYADLVLWRRDSFGIKPALVFKNGYIVWAPVGDANGSLQFSEPVIQRPMWGALGKAAAGLSSVFVSQLAIDAGHVGSLGLGKTILPISSTRHLGKADMVRNDALPQVEVDPRTYDVRVNGVLLPYTAAERVPLSRRYLLR